MLDKASVAPALRHCAHFIAQHTCIASLHYKVVEVGIVDHDTCALSEIDLQT